MGFLSLFDATERVVVAEGQDKDGNTVPYWVDLKKFLNNEDFTAASEALLQQQQLTANAGENAEGRVSARVNTNAYQQILLFRAIKEWNLTDSNDAPIPVRLETVRKLPQPVFALLLEHVTANNNPAQESREEQRSFRSVGGGVGEGESTS